MKKRLLCATISLLLLAPILIAFAIGIVPSDTDTALLIGLYSVFIGAPMSILLAGVAVFPRAFETYHPIEYILPN